MPGVVLPGYAGAVIRVGDTCYQFSGYVSDPPTVADPDGVFGTCDECASSGGDSSDTGSSTASSTASYIQLFDSSDGSSDLGSSDGPDAGSSTISSPGEEGPPAASSDGSSAEPPAAFTCGMTGCTTKIGTGIGLGSTSITCPSMLLRVSGPGPGTATWCGKDWVLPADSGKCQYACPDVYTLRKHTYTYTYSFFFSTSFFFQVSEKRQYLEEKWSHGYNNPDGLYMRKWQFKRTDLLNNSCTYKHGDVKLFVNANSDYFRWYTNGGPGGCFANVDGDLVQYDLYKLINHTVGTGKSFALTGVQPMTPGNYRLETAFFSPCPCPTATPATPSSCGASGVTIGGNTYHWQKGTFWP